jgi:hypothetical protein
MLKKFSFVKTEVKNWLNTAAFSDAVVRVDPSRLILGMTAL